LGDRFIAILLLGMIFYLTYRIILVMENIKINNLSETISADLITQIQSTELDSSANSESYLKDISEQQLSIKGGLALAGLPLARWEMKNQA
jgi:hypothetical protein